MKAIKILMCMALVAFLAACNRSDDSEGGKKKGKWDASAVVAVAEVPGWDAVETPLDSVYGGFDYGNYYDGYPEAQEMGGFGYDDWDMPIFDQWEMEEKSDAQQKEVENKSAASERETPSYEVRESPSNEWGGSSNNGGWGSSNNEGWGVSSNNENWGGSSDNEEWGPSPFNSGEAGGGFQMEEEIDFEGGWE